MPDDALIGNPNEPMTGRLEYSDLMYPLSAMFGAPTVREAPASRWRRAWRRFVAFVVRRTPDETWEYAGMTKPKPATASRTWTWTWNGNKPVGDLTFTVPIKHEEADG